jgi:hypothetical protein
MSLSQPAINGHGSNGYRTESPLLVEYSEAVERQTADDAELTSEHYTGVSHDAITNDWVCWVSGRIIGWAPRPGEAARRVRECIEAQAAHPQPTTVSTLRDDNPCSIEFQRSAKGEAYWSLKSYHAPGSEHDALTLLQELDAELTRRYRPELLPAD